MKRTVSEVEKVSEQNTEVLTSKSSQPPPKKRHGPTRCKNVVNATTLLPLRVNKYGQPIGLGSGTYTNYLGTLARNGKLAPLCYKIWWEMPKRLKEDMWNIVKGKYDVGIMSKQWTLSSIGKKWKEYKCELKSEYYSVRDTDAERLANPPPDVEKEHWEFLVRHWGTSMTKEVSEKNKERHGKQTMMRSTRTKSFACVSAEIEEKEGIQLSRADLFIRTHINKDGNATDVAASEMIVSFYASILQKGGHVQVTNF